jgi:hypothetical protein
VPFIRQSFISLAFRRQAVVPGQLNSQDPAVVVSSTHLSALARLDFHGQNWHPEIVMNEKQSMRPLQEAQVPSQQLVVGDPADRSTLLAELHLYESAGTGDPCDRSDGIREIPTSGGSEISLHADAFDGLAVRLNIAPTACKVSEVATTELLAELRRRGAMTGIHAAIGALYDQLERQGLLQDDRCTLSYLANRLRLEEARASSADGAQGSVRFWQEKIDRLASRPAG